MSTTTVAPRTGTPSDIAKLKEGYEQLVQRLLDHPDCEAESFWQLQGNVIKVGDTLRGVLGEAAWVAWRQERFMANERRYGLTRRSSITETRSSTVARPRIAPRRSGDAAEELARELAWRKRELRPSPRRISDTTVELRSPDYRDEVVLSPEARATIEDSVYHSRISTLETGGPLGGRRSSRCRISVTSARGAGSARRGYNWIDLGGVLHKFEDDVEDTPGVDLIGCWHSHPRGRTQPSEGDMITWAKMLDGVERRHGTSTLVGVIAEPSPDWRSGIGRMAVTTLHAWLVRRVSPSLVTCERADVLP
jgi:Prokaryotic homologs of the JAB domain